ncbi:hypothetical protein EDB87DRAFT_1579129 [Lactarius vividus]|nr:hypothetical protein EDB87DRAFT_1579129 [Lactarius vividus]
MATSAREQHYGPLPHEDLEEDNFYLDLLQQVTHYPDDYHHEPSTTVNTSLHIQDNPPLSPMDDALPSSIAEFPLSERHLSLGVSHYNQDLLEGGFFTEGPSSPSLLPPPPREHLCDDRNLFLTTVALGSSPEFPLSPYDQGSSQSPEVGLIPESYRITGPTSWPSPPNLDIFSYIPISDNAYHEAIGTFNPGLIQASVAAMESPMDFNAATVYTDEQVDGRLTYPMTSHQPLRGYVDCFAWMSTNDHGPSLPYSLNQHEASSPNFQSTAQLFPEAGPQPPQQGQAHPTKYLPSVWGIRMVLRTKIYVRQAPEATPSGSYNRLVTSTAWRLARRATSRVIFGYTHIHGHQVREIHLRWRTAHVWYNDGLTSPPPTSLPKSQDFLYYYVWLLNLFTFEMRGIAAPSAWVTWVLVNLALGKPWKSELAEAGITWAGDRNVWCSENVGVAGRRPEYLLGTWQPESASRIVRLPRELEVRIELHRGPKKPLRQVRTGPKEVGILGGDRGVKETGAKEVGDRGRGASGTTARITRGLSSMLRRAHDCHDPWATWRTSHTKTGNNTDTYMCSTLRLWVPS